MTLDPRKLKPTQLCRIVNGTPLGEVLTERQLLRHRNRAGSSIGDLTTVDMFRYLGWTIQKRHSPKPAAEELSYEKMKERSRNRNILASIGGRDIGELPAVLNPERKAQARNSFRFFAESYSPQTFYLPWSPDHLKIINRIEQAVLRGGLFALATPRGFGKSTLCECACIWAVLFGHSMFVCLIGSDEAHAASMLDAIKTELDNNDLLAEDFPEVVHPIRSLDGIANRCNGQLYQGRRTHIGWTAKAIELPTMPDSPASGATIKVAGLTGRIRGMKHKRADGQTVRPTLVVLDDPQTDESARSPSQCATREGILAGAVLGLAGPKMKISGILPCTVIRPSDMADNILNRDKHPEWQGERTKLVYSFPTDDKLWARYREIRDGSLKNGGDGSDATDFYRANQAAMDAGAAVAWPERFNYDEISALQYAMNLKFQDEFAFHAEYQNEPLLQTGVGADDLTADQIAAKVNRRERGTVPIDCNHVVAFIDVHKDLLYYVVAAFGDGFSGVILDYGTWPDQGMPFFTLRQATITIASATGKTGLEASLYAALERLTLELMGRSWKRDDGTILRIERCLVDAGWGPCTDLVYQFCQQSVYAALLMPSHGKYIGASSKPFDEYEQRPGEKLGYHWIMRNAAGKRAIRHATFDTNFWKSFVYSRLAQPMGEAGCWSLFGDHPQMHELFAAHLTAESRLPTEGRNRSLFEWKHKPERFDNHWLDGAVGVAVAASIQGVTLGHGDFKPKRRVLTPEQMKAEADACAADRRKKIEDFEARRKYPLG